MTPSRMHKAVLQSSSQVGRYAFLDAPAMTHHKPKICSMLSAVMTVVCTLQCAPRVRHWHDLMDALADASGMDILYCIASAQACRCESLAWKHLPVQCGLYAMQLTV